MVMDIQAAIDTFTEAPAFAVAGASQNRTKYGNKVLRCYLQNDLRTIPINPSCVEVEGQTCYPSIRAIPELIKSLSVITSPDVTERIVVEAIVAGVENIWMQPGAESALAVSKAESAGITVIAGGPCVLVVLGYHEE
jgi:predicted CoA-binding protein